MQQHSNVRTSDKSNIHLDHSKTKKKRFSIKNEITKSWVFFDI